MRNLLPAVSALMLAALLAACGGGGGGSSFTPPGGGNGGGAGLPASVAGSSGMVNGLDNVFTPADGDSSSGGSGQTIDGIPCLATMDEAHYHVHVFVGLINNGSEEALPDGTGMNNPGADSGGVVSTASCFYYLHTHDASGVVHIEDPSTASRTTSLHTLGQYLDIWGQPVSGTRVYTSGARYQGEGDQTVSNTTYVQYTGDPHAIPLYAHEVIWFEWGPNYPAASSLPSVHFSY
ncbi:MAG: hypothetical protein ABR508_06345 [Candidatus Baltobacteraceae bacterium]